MLKYKDYLLIKPRGDQIERINGVIEEFKGSIFHDYELNLLASEKFKTDLHYLVDNSVSFNNCSPIHIVKNKIGLKRFHFKPLFDIPYAGMVGRDNFDSNSISVNMFESFSYQGFPTKNGIVGNQGSRLLQTAMVDLTFDEDEIFNDIINSKRRNMIRKASKSGISIKSFFSIEGLELFWPILKGLHDKLGFAHLPYEYYAEMFDLSNQSNKAFVLLAYKDEVPVSGIFVIGNRNYMHYYKGASVFGVKNQGQGELLQWEAMKMSKSLGVKYYDMCNIDKVNLPEIYRFKTGLAKEIVDYPYFSYSNFGYKVLNKLSGMI